MSDDDDDDLDVTALTARDRKPDADATEKNDISSPDVDPPKSVPPAAASSSASVAPVRRPASSGESPAPPSVSRTSVPPSEPRTASRGSFSQLDLAAADRPARLQMIVALVLGLVLVAIPLYLWRRPRADAVAVSTGDAADSVPPPPPAMNEDKPAVSEVRTLACQDPGPKKTSPGECDHLADIEKALTKAIEDSASCITKDLGGGTIEYVADVSFRQKKINVVTPKDGHSLHNAKAVAVCQAAVKSRLAAVPLDPVQHAHARYKLSATATYTGPVK